jgi:NAD(P)-dependent dehydrogenase (short-subunit alcohol dehydrogenase family)
MIKNKKILLVGVTAALAGIGIYKYVTSKQYALPTEIWTTEDMPDLTGKVIIVTGANSGIGYEAAKEFARKGAQTILACRSMEKAQAAFDQIQTEIPDAPAEIMMLDLASLESVRKFTDQFKAQYERLDVLLNNAGIMMVPYGVTQDGFERQFGINHLGHFALTGLLTDLITKTPGARVVNVSSNAHRRGNMNFENIMYDGGQGYNPQGAYGRSKLANLLFTFELQRRFEANGINAIAAAAHPGISQTNLANHLPMINTLRPVMERVVQSSAMGALPSIRAAVDPQARGGQYFGPSGFQEFGGYPVIVQPSDASHNLTDAQQLWDISEKLTGVHFLSNEIEILS